MIAYGCAVTEQLTFERCAEPGIRRAQAAAPGSELLAYTGSGSIFRNYNLILDRVAERDDVEALVLVHQDAEIVDPEFVAKLRRALSDRDVALVGAAGAIDVRSIAWWEGAVTWASFTHRYGELGGGEIPGASWRNGRPLPAYVRTGDVDTIDGFVIGMSPWAVRELRFDETLGRHHGYDLDICLQARAAGKRVVTADLRVVHHHSLRLLEDAEEWIQAYMRVAQKWEGMLPAPAAENGDWKRRALRAEAEAAAARLVAGEARLQGEARAAQLEREIEAIKATKAWRLVAPARSLKRRLARGG